MRLLLAVLALALLCSPALAKGQPQPVPAFHLTGEDGPSNPWSWHPSWCLSEDSWHNRTWEGYLHGTFETTEAFCDPTVDFVPPYPVGWDGGGMGLGVYARVAGAPIQELSLSGSSTDITPSTFTQQPRFTGTTVTGKGRNAVTWFTYTMAVCYAANPDTLLDFSAGQLIGPWTFRLTGDFTDSYVELEATMPEKCVTYA